MLDEKIAKQYKSGDYSYPSDLIDPKKKNRAWYLKSVQAFTYEYVNNLCAIPYDFSNIRGIKELRQYARGTQPVEKYQNYICNLKGNDPNEKLFLNISWDPPRIMPKFRDVIKGIAMGLDFDVNIVASDPSSATEKEKEKAYYKLQINEKFKKFKESAKKLGVSTEEFEMQFNNNQEIETFFEAGGFKLGIEIAAMACIIQSKNLSDMDVIKDQCIEDLIDLGYAVMADEITAGGEVRARYVDAANFTCSYSNLKDHRNMYRWAEMRYMTVRELREQTQLTEDEVCAIASKYATMFGNSGYAVQARFFTDNKYRDDFFQRNGTLPYYDFTVPVMQYGFVSTDVETFTKVINRKGGNVVFNDVDYGHELTAKDLKDGKELIRNKTEYVHECKWIPGTDCIFDYGKSLYQTREGQIGTNEVRGPYHMYKTGTSSIVERCIPFIDDISMAVFKKRAAVASLPPAPRMVIEKSLLENITLGGTEYTPQQAMDMFFQKGTLYIQSLDDFGEQRTGTTTNPVQFLPNAIAEDLVVFTNEVIHGIEMIRNVTGVNEFVDGSTPAERTAVGLANIASLASNNTLRPLFTAYDTMYRNLARNWVKRWQLLCVESGYKKTVRAIGEENYRVITLTKDFALADFGIFIQKRDTVQEREQLLSEITQLRNANVTNNGQGGITPDTYVMIRQIIMSGNIPMAQRMMAIALNEQRERDRALEMERINANANVQQQSAMVAAQEERKTSAQKHREKMSELALEGYIKANLIREEADVEKAMQNINTMFAEPQRTPTPPNETNMPNMAV